MFAAALALSAAALESMAFDLDSPQVKAWFADNSDANYPVNVVAKLALKPEMANDAGRKSIADLIKLTEERSVAEAGNQHFHFRNDLWDQYSFWTDEAWASKRALLRHISPQGALGKVVANFTAISTLHVAFFKDVSPFLNLRMLHASGAAHENLEGCENGKCWPQAWCQDKKKGCMWAATLNGLQCLCPGIPTPQLATPKRLAHSGLSCSTLDSACGAVFNAETVAITSFTGCTLSAAGIAAACELAGLGPEDPFADACAAALGFAFETGCLVTVGVGGVFGKATCSKVVEDAHFCHKDALTDPAPPVQDGCWNYPKAGTERCPIEMNVDTSGPRMTHYFNDNERLDDPVVLYTKWTLKENTAAARAKWIQTMRKGQTLTHQNDKGYMVYKWGQDVFNKNAFWGYETWATKRDFIAHCTTGVFGQNQRDWLEQVDMEVSIFDDGPLKFAKAITF